MSSLTELECRLYSGPQKSRDLHRKIMSQLNDAKKILILSSFDKIKNYNETQIKNYSTPSKAIWNITTVLLHFLCYRQYCYRVPYFGNIINFNSYRQSDNIDINIHIENRDNYLSFLDEYFFREIPDMINNYEEINHEFKELYFKLTATINEKVIDKPLLDAYYLNNNDKISYSTDKNIKLRLLKKMACKLKYQEGLSRKEILKKIPINMNQLKDALKNYKEGDVDTVVIEKRGAHNKKDAIRTKSNIDYIENLIYHSETKYTLNEIKKKFESEVLGYECSKDVIYKIINDNLKCYVRKPLHIKNDMNIPGNKDFRLYYTLMILKAFANNDYIVFIDEIKLKDYRKVDKIDDILTKRDDIESTGKSELIFYTLLLACSKNEVLGYYIIEGPVTPLIYLSFIERISNTVFDKTKGEKAYIVMDDVKSHKALMVKKFMTTRRFLRFIYIRADLPEYNFVYSILKKIRSNYIKSRIKYNK